MKSIHCPKDFDPTPVGPLFQVDFQSFVELDIRDPKNIYLNQGSGPEKIDSLDFMNRYFKKLPDSMPCRYKNPLDPDDVRYCGYGQLIGELGLVPSITWDMEVVRNEADNEALAYFLTSGDCLEPRIGNSLEIISIDSGLDSGGNTLDNPVILLHRR